MTEKKTKCYLFGIKLSFDNTDPAQLIRVYEFPKTQSAKECFDLARDKAIVEFVKDRCVTAQIVSMSPIQ